MKQIYTNISDDNFNFIRGLASIIIPGLGLWHLMCVEVIADKNKNSGLSENLTFIMGMIISIFTIGSMIYIGASPFITFVIYCSINYLPFAFAMQEYLKK